MDERSEDVALYQTAPSRVTAVQWTGENAAAVQRLVGRLPLGTEGFMVLTNLTTRRPGRHASLWVQKSRRWCDVDPGTFVIAEPDGGGFYPCTEAVFRDKYEPVVIARTDPPA